LFVFTKKYSHLPDVSIPSTDFGYDSEWFTSIRSYNHRAK